MCFASCFETPTLLIILTNPFGISSSCDRIFTFSSKANKSCARKCHTNTLKNKCSYIWIEKNRNSIWHPHEFTMYNVVLQNYTKWGCRSYMKKQEHCSGADDSPTLFNQVTTRFDERSLKITCRNRAKLWNMSPLPNKTIMQSCAACPNVPKAVNEKNNEDASLQNSREPRWMKIWFPTTA